MSFFKRLVTMSVIAVIASGALAQTSLADTAGTGHSKLASISDGETLFQHVCQSCHMADARGAMGAGAKIPALAGNNKLAAKGYLAYVVVHGFAGMPALGGMLSDQQIASISNYVRTHFGNSYEPDATDKMVHAIR